MILLDSWLVIVTVLCFAGIGLFAAGCDRLLGTKR